MNIWKDPDRWVDADLSREEWGIYIRSKLLWLAAVAFALTVALVVIGVLMS
jgi:hypothetical protein